MGMRDMGVEKVVAAANQQIRRGLLFAERRSEDGGDFLAPDVVCDGDGDRVSPDLEVRHAKQRGDDRGVQNTCVTGLIRHGQAFVEQGRHGRADASFRIDGDRCCGAEQSLRLMPGVVKLALQKPLERLSLGGTDEFGKSAGQVGLGAVQASDLTVKKLLQRVKRHRHPLASLVPGDRNRSCERIDPRSGRPVSA